MPTIETARGPKDPQDLGITLPHEHLFSNMGTGSPGTLLADPDALRRELDDYRAAGGGAIVDLTPAEVTDGAYGRAWGGPRSDLSATDTRAIVNVREIARLSDEAGIDVVLGTGHYREPYLDREWMDRHSTDDVAAAMIRDLTEGFPTTEIRAGIIGEIASNAWYITAAEERSFRAAARAHRATGAAISTHATDWPTGLDQLRLLEEEGVAPEPVIIGHVDTVPDPDYALRLLQEGAWVQLDTFFHCRMGGRVVPGPLADRADLLRRLLDAGHHERILISHDVCVPALTGANGGVGYSFLLGEGRDLLVEAGIDPAFLTAALTTNVWRALERP